MSNKIGIFGTCRIDDFNIENFKQIKKTYPFIYKNETFQINIRPLGYSTTTSDIIQNLKLIKTNNYKKITDKFIYKNVLLKHKGKDIITDLDYKILVLEICSLKKIIHKKSNLIFPFEIEGQHNKNDFLIQKETPQETLHNILQIRDLLNCPIILLPPIIFFNEEVKLGIHEDTTLNKVLDYRKNIINILEDASKYPNIYFIDWNNYIKEQGISKMVKDQFHFTDFGKKYISSKILENIKNIIYI